jgi:hypothetical protein
MKKNLLRVYEWITNSKANALVASLVGFITVAFLIVDHLPKKGDSTVATDGVKGGLMAQKDARERGEGGLDPSQVAAQHQASNVQTINMQTSGQNSPNVLSFNGGMVNGGSASNENAGKK